MSRRRNYSDHHRTALGTVKLSSLISSLSVKGQEKKVNGVSQTLIALGNLKDELVELHNDCTQKLKKVRPDNTKTILVLTVRRNAIDDCIAKLVSIRRLYIGSISSVGFWWGYVAVGVES